MNPSIAERSAAAAAAAHAAFITIIIAAILHHRSRPRPVAHHRHPCAMLLRPLPLLPAPATVIIAGMIAIVCIHDMVCVIRVP